MKNIIKIITLLLFISCKAQTIVNVNTYNQGDNSNKYFKDINNNYQNFIGTWENTYGNLTFRLEIWKNSNIEMPNESNSRIDLLNAKFSIIKFINTPSEIVLHNSVKYFPQNGYTSNNVMIAFALNNYSFSGFFTDTCANGGAGVLDASFSFEILNIGNTPLQAQWKLKSVGQLSSEEFFTVPTNCILIKQ